MNCLSKPKTQQAKAHGEQKSKLSSWKYALVVAEPLWDHNWGFIVESHFNSRKDYYDVIGKYQ